MEKSGATRPSLKPCLESTRKSRWKPCLKPCLESTRKSRWKPRWKCRCKSSSMEEKRRITCWIRASAAVLRLRFERRVFSSQELRTTWALPAVSSSGSVRHGREVLHRSFCDDRIHRENPPWKPGHNHGIICRTGTVLSSGTIPAFGLRSYSREPIHAFKADYAPDV